jgi:hypothetical protein
MLLVLKIIFKKEKIGENKEEIKIRVITHPIG